MTELLLYLDFKCPASYLAVRPTLELARSGGARVRWRPFRAWPAPVPARKPDETKGETHRRVRAVQRRAVHQLYADVQGLPALRFREDETRGGTDAALAVLAALAGPAGQDNDEAADPVPYVQAAFRAYWSGDANLDDPALVTRLARDSGLPPGLPLQGPQAMIRALDAHQHQAEQDSIFATPTYRIAGQDFVGREHLPWIREILAAKG